MKKNNIILGAITLVLLSTSLTSCGGCEHSYVFVKEVPSTCKSEGVASHYTCEHCDSIFDENKEKTTLEDLTLPKEHKTLFVEGKDPTCTEDGYYGHYKCQYCDSLFSDEDGENQITIADVLILSAKEHTLRLFERVEPGCVTTGNIKYYQCEECDEYFLDEKGENSIEFEDIFLESLGHRISRISGVTRTCDKDGVIEHFYCDRCETHYEDELGTVPMSENSWILEAKHELVHRTVQDATYNQDGISVDHYHCETCLKNFTDESATTLVTGDIVEPAYKKSFSFEDGNIHPYISELEGATLSITDTVASKGNKSLKAELGSRGFLKLAFNRKWLNKVFELNNAEALYFDIKAEEAASDFYYNSISNVWGVVRYEPGNKVDIGVISRWKTVTFTKTMLEDLSSDNVVIRIDNSPNNVIYIDNIRMGKINESYSFEHNGVSNPNPYNDYQINCNYDDTLEVLVNTPNSIVELSNTYASDGKTSLHVKTNQATSLNVYIPLADYQAMSGSKGIMFDLYISSADVMHVYTNDNISPRPYINDVNFGKWTTMFIEYSSVLIEGQYARILGTRGNYNFDFYIDNIRKVEEYTMDFETENLIDVKNSDGFGALFVKDFRNTYTITDEQSYSGSYSVKINKPNETYTRAFGISDSMYKNIPSTGGIKFYFFADGQMNLTPNGECHYYANELGTWKEMIIPKSLINSAETDHYVFLISEPANIYIDCISIVNSI